VRPSRSRRAIIATFWLPPTVALAVAFGTGNAFYGASAFFTAIAVLITIVAISIMEGY
jgi:hypothetical protein